jgi:MerR family transcriptional regulator, light-induced transcriptional regulator
MFSIGFVSRETGISAATLRRWEERYGFPKPNRENDHTRTYSEEDLSYLREIKRLIDQGTRASKLFSGDFKRKIPIPSDSLHHKQVLFIKTALEFLVTHRTQELRLMLERNLKRMGIFSFVKEIADPLTVAVGENWANGTISVFAEHCYSEQISALLTNAVKTKQPVNNSPRILLATLPSEKHNLGLLMVQAVLFEQGACCINLGTELPLVEFSKAVSHYQANIMGVSFSVAFPKRAIKAAIVQLRASLPAETTLWIGGTGAKKLKALPEGVQVLTSADEIVATYHDYKEHL